MYLIFNFSINNNFSIYLFYYFSNVLSKYIVIENVKYKHEMVENHWLKVLSLGITFKRF